MLCFAHPLNTAQVLRIHTLSQPCAARSLQPVQGYQLHAQKDTPGAELECARINDTTLATIASKCDSEPECSGFTVWEGADAQSAGFALPMYCLKYTAFPLESRAASYMPSPWQGFYERGETLLCWSVERGARQSSTCSTHMDAWTTILGCVRA